MDKFTAAYIECALWSSNDESDESGGNPIDENYGVEDIALDSMAKIEADCAQFQENNTELLAQVPHLNPRWSTEEQNGHDFWLTRNGHGAGFWDRGYGEIGDKLSKACEAFGDCNVLIGDKGKLHFE